MSGSNEVYRSRAAMEPLLPGEPEELTELAVRIVLEAGRLSAGLHPVTRQGVSALVRTMNSYYSNLIEGHHTHPADIERALREDYSTDPAKRALQQESKAHIEVQELLESQLASAPELNVCSADFLRRIHRQFYERLPTEFQIVKTKSGREDTVVPGEFRRCEVEIGRHLAPGYSALPEFLHRFETGYSPTTMSPLTRVIAAAASHHRLTWIHPFLDGNGRVARLFTHAYLSRLGLSADGLWTISRGFARRRNDYFAALSAADAPRRNDYDGRENLSLAGLIDFCRFFLETCLDQIHFMSTLFEIDAAQHRIAAFGARWAALERQPAEVAQVLRDCFIKGTLSRGEATQRLNKPERTARRTIGKLLDAGLLVSDAPGRPLRLGFPHPVVGYYFPRLFPESVEF